jgi:hypothetical protein
MSLSVGDKVVIHTNFYSDNMKSAYDGKVAKIVKIDNSFFEYKYVVDIDHNCFLWSDIELKPYKDAKQNRPDILIRCEGNSVVAFMYKDYKCVKKAKATCNPKDKFRYDVGVRMALDRLFSNKSNDIASDMDLTRF